VDVLREIHEWAGGQDMRHIFWLNGLAGTGKSTIARTVAHQYSENKGLGASFFFLRGSGDASHADKFVTTIAVQLANNVPSLKHYICKAIADCSNIASQSLRDQWHQLITSPLSELDSHGYRSSYILVVDALDECDNDKDVQIILKLLAEVRLRVFLTSRPEIPIRHGFYEVPAAQHRDLILHSISPLIVDHDISLFLEHNLVLIGRENSLDAGWPAAEAIRRLVENASGLFIWAATACRFIREGKRFATKRLAIILDGSDTGITAPGRHLHEIYLTVLKQSVFPGYTDEEKDDLYAILRHVLGSIVALLSPLPAYSLGSLLHLPKEDIDQALEDLHAILDIPEDQTRPLRLHHPSFRDFLLNKDRCDDPTFQVDEKEVHRKLTNECIRLMTVSLKQDICGLGTPDVLVTDINRGRVRECISPEVQYACLYWVQHLQKSDVQLCDNDHVHQFLQVHLLYWFEVLSWTRKVLEGITAISLLYSIAQVC
jgi:NACHT domain